MNCRAKFIKYQFFQKTLLILIALDHFLESIVTKTKSESGCPAIKLGEISQLVEAQLIFRPICFTHTVYLRNDYKCITVKKNLLTKPMI